MQNKMKKYGRGLLLAGMAALVCLFFYLSAAYWGRLGWSRDYLLSCISEPISENQASALMKEHLQRLEKEIPNSGTQEEIPDFCIWGQKDQVLLTNENLSRVTQADVILFCGNVELLFQNCRTPEREDLQGCLVDEETAWNLFGSIQVIGKEITYEKRPYIIRNVISGKNGIAAFPAAGGKAAGGTAAPTDQGQSIQTEEKVLNRVTIKKPQPQSVSEVKAGWESRCGMELKILDLELLRGLEGICVFLVPITVCVVFLHNLCSQYRKEESWKGRAVTLCLILLFVLSAFMLYGRWVQIPDDYIPPKWSDFEFWSQLIEQKQQSLRLLLRVSKTALDDGWGRNGLAGAGFGILAEVLAVILLFSWKCFKIESTVKNPTGG